MKKHSLLFLLFAVMLLSVSLFIPVNAGDDEETEEPRPSKMAHNIYMNPDINGGSGEYRAFQIDFCGIETPVDTYWALCNWEMKGGFGAYSGLQNTIYGRKALLSFWEGEKNGKVLRARRIYPYGFEEAFDGEGEGTHYLGDYEWNSGEWYRMFLYCWEDSQTGHTFVGQWVIDLSTGKWTLMSYFDTRLKESALTGALSMFQENFAAGTDYLPRSFRVKNIYALDMQDDQWLSLDSSRMSYDPASWGFNTAGTHEFGAGEDYFWGRAGEYVEDQQEYDAKMPMSLSLSINQPDKPETADSLVSDLKAQPLERGIDFSWSVDDHSAPVVSVKITLYDAEGEVLKEKTLTRPERSDMHLDVESGYVEKAELKTTDVYGNTHVFEINIGRSFPDANTKLTRTVTVPLDAAGISTNAVISTCYWPETEYYGKVPEPEKALGAVTDVRLSGFDGLTDVKYVKGSKKKPGEAQFYPRLVLNKARVKEAALGKAEKKQLNKALKLINKELKKKENRISYTISPRLLKEDDITIEIKTSKKGKMSIKKLKINIVFPDGEEKLLKISKSDYKAVIDNDNRIIKIEGRKNYTGKYEFYP